MAARRDAPFSNDINGLIRPNSPKPPIETNGKNRSTANAMSLYAQDRHKRAARALGYALTLADRAWWSDTAVIWEARLDRAERYELARSVMLAMPPDDIEALCADVLTLAGRGAPLFEEMA